VIEEVDVSELLNFEAEQQPKCFKRQEQNKQIASAFLNDVNEFFFFFLFLVA